MTDGIAPRTGTRILVDGLAAQGIGPLFCGPGDAPRRLGDAAHGEALALTLCHGAAGAATMADAVARLADRPGLCWVADGPGAVDVLPALHAAQRDAMPLILLVGPVARRRQDGLASEAMDHRTVFGGVARWIGEVEDAASIPEVLSRAVHAASQGRPGPVAVTLTEAALSGMAAVEDAPRPVPALPWPGLPQMAEMQKMLWAAERPLLMLGGSGWTAAARAATVRFAERFALPVVTSPHHPDLFDAAHPGYAGMAGVGADPKLRRRIADADLLLVVGAGLGDVPPSAAPRQKLVHVHADAGEVGRGRRTALAIQAAPRTFAASLEAVQPPQVLPWAGAAERARAEHLAWTALPPATPGALDVDRILAWLCDRLPSDAVVIHDAGRAALGPWRSSHCGTRLAPASGAVGYGVPAAVGAKRLDPSRDVVALVDDDGVLATGQDFATAVRYGLAVTVIAIDGDPATRPFDGAAFARALGGHGEAVARTEDFAPAYERALASGRPAILHLTAAPDPVPSGTIPPDTR